MYRWAKASDSIAAGELILRWGVSAEVCLIGGEDFMDVGWEGDEKGGLAEGVGWMLG